MKLNLDMTVDTGADLTMIPYLVGWNLGFRGGRSKTSTLSGISGGTPYLLKRINMTIGPFSFSARIAWAQSDEVPILLGRTDVLDRLVTVFDGKRRQVTFRE